MRPDHDDKHHGDKANGPFARPEGCRNHRMTEFHIPCTDKNHDIPDHCKKHKPQGQLPDPEKINCHAGQTELVGKGIKNFSHFRNLVSPSGRLAVEPVGQNSNNHDNNGRFEMTCMKIIEKPGYQYYSQEAERIRQIKDTTFHSNEFIIESYQLFVKDNNDARRCQKLPNDHIGRCVDKF